MQAGWKRLARRDHCELLVFFSFSKSGSWFGGAHQSHIKHAAGERAIPSGKADNHMAVLSGVKHGGRQRVTLFKKLAGARAVGPFGGQERAVGEDVKLAASVPAGVGHSQVGG